MKRNILILLSLIFILNGCLYQAELRPEYNDTDVWICEKPYIELYWSKSHWNAGVISYDGIQYDITHEENYGSLILIYTAEAKGMRDLDKQQEFLVFKGHADYGKDSLSIEVEKDYKNVFNGELPTLEFKRYKKEEYFKSKED